MQKLKGSRTEHNLMAAFAGESQARNRYTFYAGIASKEGHEGIAANFLETAEHEKMHAKRYFKLLEGLDVEIKAGYPSRIGSTAVNLEAAAAGEHEEWTNIYPTFGKIAEEEGFAAPAAIFRRIAEVEVDTETGEVKVLDYVSTVDCGTAVNPTLAEIRAAALTAQEPERRFLARRLRELDGPTT